MSYLERYQQMTRPLRQSQRVTTALLLSNSLITKLMYTLYPFLLVYLYGKNRGLFLRYLLIPGVFFLLVTLLRKVFNKARPYETWAIEPVLKKETKGQSMPSRHVFSATMIAMCFLSLSWPIGLVLIVLSLLLAVCRVLGGVHYPIDVAVGFGIAVLAGGLLFL